ncbi:DUF3094 family protein [Porticoccus sp. GXU_MW_L64]
MRSEDELYPEDLERVRKVTTSGVHSVKRQPFRFWRLLLAVWLVILFMSGMAWLVATQVGILV